MCVADWGQFSVSVPSSLGGVMLWGSWLACCVCLTGGVNGAGGTSNGGVSESEVTVNVDF